MKKTMLTGLLVAICFLATAQKKYEPNWASIDSRPIPDWFEDAKFGIFIHWGLFSVPSWAPNNVSVYDKYSEWYWWRLTDPKSETYPYFNKFHKQVYGEDFKYQDFVKDFKAE